PGRAVRNDEKIYIARFKLASPSPLIDEIRLNEIVREFTGREDTLADLNQAAVKVANELRRKGHAFTRVVVPPQEVVDGVVALDVASGKLDTDGSGIVVKEASGTRLSPERARAIAAEPITDPRGLNVTQVERGLLLLNDLPGVRATATVEPGVDPES